MIAYPKIVRMKMLRVHLSLLMTILSLSCLAQFRKYSNEFLNIGAGARGLAMVYYWRVAPVPSSGQPKWNTASFVYLANSDPGFNQSHFYQHLKSDEQKIVLDSTTRKWHFDSLVNNLLIRCAIFPTAATQQGDFALSVNDAAIIGGGCSYQSLIINVFDGRSFKPMDNVYSGGHGLYGSLPSAWQSQEKAILSILR